MDYQNLFNRIKTSGSSGGARKKVNTEFRNAGWSENQIATARACVANSLSTVSDRLAGDVVNQFKQLKISDDLNTTQVDHKLTIPEIKSDFEYVDANELVIKEGIIKKLKELKEVYKILKKDTNEFDQLFEYLQ